MSSHRLSVHLHLRPTGLSQFSTGLASQTPGTDTPFGLAPGGFSNRLLSSARPFAQAHMHPRYLSATQASAYSFRTLMSTLNSPERPERRGIRYPLHMPVSLKFAHKEMHARSENISLGGILLSSAFLIPEGSTVEVAVGVAQLPDAGSQLNARGKVLRVQPKATGDFSVAIVFERPFELGLRALDSSASSQRQSPDEERRFPPVKNRMVPSQRLHLTAAWHTET
jgi:hypothetical protein